MTTTPKNWLVDGDEWWVIETPVGSMLIAGNDEVLHNLFLPNATEELRETLDESREGRPGAVAETERQVKEYFAGERTDFDLPLDPIGTEFQRSVWMTLGTIPYGETATYGDIAAKVGKPTAFRAVGATNGRNPLALVLPCHRVIGANGKLVGFGGGLDLKQQLLDHEQAVLAEKAVV